MRRWNWVKRSLISPDRDGEGGGDVGGGGGLGAAFASDPATWEQAFESHWQQAEAVMRATERATITHDHLLAAFKHLDHMLWLLMTEVFHTNY